MKKKVWNTIAVLVCSGLGCSIAQAQSINYQVGGNTPVSVTSGTDFTINVGTVNGTWVGSVHAFPKLLRAMTWTSITTCRSSTRAISIAL